MKTKLIVLISVLASLILLAVIVRAYFYHTYTNFDIYSVEVMGREGFAENHYESCICIGSFQVMESYPPVHDCSGIELCQDIDDG